MGARNRQLRPIWETDLNIENTWQQIIDNITYDGVRATADDAGPNIESYEGFFAQYVKEAVGIEMEKRGYSRSDTPDLLVNFNLQTEEKTQISTTPSMGGYYGYRRARYGTWGGYRHATETHVSQYTEGTFNIDIVSSAENQLVWEAVGVGRISDATRENMREKIFMAVPLYFAGYPFVAGSNTPVTSED